MNGLVVAVVLAVVELLQAGVKIPPHRAPLPRQAIPCQSLRLLTPHILLHLPAATPTVPLHPPTTQVRPTRRRTRAPLRAAVTGDVGH